MSFIKHAVHHMPHQSCMCLRPAPSCGAGAHGSEEGREGAGVTQQLVSPRLPAEVAAADARGGGAVLQHQEAECGEAAAGGQRRGKGTCESVGTHLRDLCVGSVGFRAQGSKRWRRKREILSLSYSLRMAHALLCHKWVGLKWWHKLSHYRLETTACPGLFRPSFSCIRKCVKSNYYF